MRKLDEKWVKGVTICKQHLLLLKLSPTNNLQTVTVVCCRFSQIFNKPVIIRTQNLWCVWKLCAQWLWPFLNVCSDHQSSFYCGSYLCKMMDVHFFCDCSLFYSILTLQVTVHSTWKSLKNSWTGCLLLLALYCISVMLCVVCQVLEKMQ